jgi:hypothetical protein
VPGRHAGGKAIRHYIDMKFHEIPSKCSNPIGVWEQLLLPCTLKEGFSTALISYIVEWLGDLNHQL